MKPLGAFEHKTLGFIIQRNRCFVNIISTPNVEFPLNAAGKKGSHLI